VALSARRVLVLGGTGMLGSMVCRVLARNPDLAVARTTRGGAAAASPAGLSAEFPLDAERADDSELATALDRFQPGYVVNCIGVINVHCRDGDPAGVRTAVRVNALFPHVLAAVLRARRSAAGPAHDRLRVRQQRQGVRQVGIHDPVDFCGNKSWASAAWAG
jgi:dTDP-4-dehydrorhamnose reductase